MLNNNTFLKKIQDSFRAFITSGTSRSTAKLKPLHGAIAQDIADRLGNNYIVKSQGFGDGKEACIKGRYVNKIVDITVRNKATGEDIAGIAVKFVMQNYSQNSNNYFENMLGETANIRTANCPYFQIFIILDELPYYKSNGELSKWEEFTSHNIMKYCLLSHDNTSCFFHTPNKTLIYVVHVSPDAGKHNIHNKADYLNFFQTHAPKVRLSTNQYPKIKPNGTVILNDYESFTSKVYHTIMAH